MTVSNFICIRRIVFLLVLLSSGSLAWASPEDDYQTGKKMYGAGDLVGAMPFLKKAADGGHAAAQALYGGIAMHGGADDVEAASYFTKAAEQGNAEGQYRLGTSYAAGEGVKRDFTLAMKWLVKAADQGHGPAINALAIAYLTDTMGVPEDVRKSEEALRRIRQAAENKFLPAIREMVKAYRNGEYGLTPDGKLAGEWAAREAKETGVSTDKRAKRGSKK